jgi:hypothetical protein
MGVHCIIHEQALYGKSLDTSCVMVYVVSAVDFFVARSWIIFGFMLS